MENLSKDKKIYFAIADQAKQIFNDLKIKSGIYKANEICKLLDTKEIDFVANYEPKEVAISVDGFSCKFLSVSVFHILKQFKSIASISSKEEVIFTKEEEQSNLIKLYSFEVTDALLNCSKVADPKELKNIPYTAIHIDAENKKAFATDGQKMNVINLPIEVADIPLLSSDFVSISAKEIAKYKGKTLTVSKDFSGKKRIFADTIEVADLAFIKLLAYDKIIKKSCAIVEFIEPIKKVFAEISKLFAFGDIAFISGQIGAKQVKVTCKNDDQGTSKAITFEVADALTYNFCFGIDAKHIKNIFTFGKCLYIPEELAPICIGNKNGFSCFCAFGSSQYNYNKIVWNDQAEEVAPLSYCLQLAEEVAPKKSAKKTAKKSAKKSAKKTAKQADQIAEEVAPMQSAEPIAEPIEIATISGKAEEVAPCLPDQAEPIAESLKADTIEVADADQVEPSKAEEVAPKKSAKKTAKKSAKKSAKKTAKQADQIAEEVAPMQSAEPIAEPIEIATISGKAEEVAPIQAEEVAPCLLLTYQAEPIEVADADQAEPIAEPIEIADQIAEEFAPCLIIAEPIAESLKAEPIEVADADQVEPSKAEEVAPIQTKQNRLRLLTFGKYIKQAACFALLLTLGILAKSFATDESKAEPIEVATVKAEEVAPCLLDTIAEEVAPMQSAEPIEIATISGKAEPIAESLKADTIEVADQIAEEVAPCLLDTIAEPIAESLKADTIEVADADQVEPSKAEEVAPKKSAKKTAKQPDQIAEEVAPNQSAEPIAEEVAPCLTDQAEPIAESLKAEPIEVADADQAEPIAESLKAEPIEVADHNKASCLQVISGKAEEVAPCIWFNKDLYVIA